jgi:uncharacterized membrane protein (DUF2068 family)
MYLPLEINELIHKHGLLSRKVSALILVTNIIVVWYLALCLKRGIGKKVALEESHAEDSKVA